jgi:hypothetical protein
MAQNEMIKLGSQQVRMGHLRSQDRQRLSMYQDRQAQHTERIARTISSLGASTAAHPDAAGCAEIAKGARGAIARAAAGDPGLAGLHAQMTDLHAAQAQQFALAGTNAHLDRWGAGDASTFQRGRAAPYWGHRAMFGADGDGTPRTAGQWAKDGAVGTVNKVRRGVSTAASLFTLFEGIQMLTRSVSVFETKVTTVQELGSKLSGTMMGVGDAFAYVDEKLTGRTKSGGRPQSGLQKEFGYTLSQLTPGMREMVKHTGSLDGMRAALRMGRGTRIGPSTMDEYIPGRAKAAARYAQNTGIDGGESGQLYRNLLLHIAPITSTVTVNGREGPPNLVKAPSGPEVAIFQASHPEVLGSGAANNMTNISLLNDALPTPKVHYSQRTSHCSNSICGRPNQLCVWHPGERLA